MSALDELINRSKKSLDVLLAKAARAELAALRGRVAQLEVDNDEMQSYINEIRVALHTEKDELTINAVRRVISELAALRDSLGAWSTLWLHICQRLDADADMLPNESNFDAMITVLRATVAEQARQLDETRSALEAYQAHNPQHNDVEAEMYAMGKAALAANAPAPQTEYTK